jgi:hypothetical protein
MSDRKYRIVALHENEIMLDESYEPDEMQEYEQPLPDEVDVWLGDQGDEGD